MLEFDNRGCKQVCEREKVVLSQTHGYSLQVQRHVQSLDLDHGACLPR